MLYKKACAYCETNGIFSLMENARGVIVGFSGGADSAVLLSFFDSLKERFPRLRIIAAHVNHMIRGEEAKRDAAFAEGFCIERGIDFELLTVDVPAEAKEQGLGLEEAARNIRYDFFDSLCKKHSADLIATAHNSDDNLETVIMNLMRGSGTKGASGIAPIRDGRLIRPLICCTGEEIRSFARQRSIPYVQDSTNLCTDYSRNAVRHRLVPLMRESNPKVAEAALRLSQAAREDCDFIEGEAKKILSAGPLSRKALAKLHPALFQRVLLELYKKEAGTALNLSEKNISNCRRLISGTEFGSVSLPRELALFADKDQVYIAPDTEHAQLSSHSTDDILPLLEDTPLFFFDYCIIASKKDEYKCAIDENIYKLSLHMSIDCDKISGELFVRQRRPGDTFRLRGLNRKLKKLLCDESVPVHLRSTLPLIGDSEGILAVPFIGVRDGASQKDTGKSTIKIHILKRN